MSPSDLEELRREHVADIHLFEMRVRDLERDIAEAHNRLVELDAWRKLDMQRSHWFYEHESTIRDVVENATSLRRVKTWVIGLAGMLAGVMMIWQAVWPFIRDHHK